MDDEVEKHVFSNHVFTKASVVNKVRESKKRNFAQYRDMIVSKKDE
jgi:hypothetical protein